VIGPLRGTAQEAGVEAMTVLLRRLREKIPAIAQRWLTEALAAYPAQSAAAFRRETDRFANPVGHALAAGTRAALEALLEGRDADEISACLEETIKIRAIQEFQPSQALAFVFSLKEAIRAELGREGNDPALGPGLADLDKRIDQAALGAFDLYMRHRSRVYELRINEVKRNIAVIAERAGLGSLPPEPAEDVPQAGASECAETQRGGRR